MVFTEQEFIELIKDPDGWVFESELSDGIEKSQKFIKSDGKYIEATICSGYGVILASNGSGVEIVYRELVSWRGGKTEEFDGTDCFDSGDVVEFYGIEVVDDHEGDLMSHSDLEILFLQNANEKFTTIDWSEILPTTDDDDTIDASPR